MSLKPLLCPLACPRKCVLRMTGTFLTLVEKRAVWSKGDTYIFNETKWTFIINIWAFFLVSLLFSRTLIGAHQRQAARASYIFYFRRRLNYKCCLTHIIRIKGRPGSWKAMEWKQDRSAGLWGMGRLDKKLVRIIGILQLTNLD